MTFKRKLILLISPSWMSITCGAILSFMFIGLTSFIFAQHSGLFGSFTPWTYVQSTSLPNFFNMLRSSINDVRLTSVFFIVFWILIGFIAYNIIIALKGSVDESVGFMMQLRYVNAKPKLMGVHAIIRYILLLLAIMLWVLFALIFSWMILPLVLNLINKTFTKSGSPLYIILSFLLFLVTAHVAAMILRFTFLRARLTSGAR